MSAVRILVACGVFSASVFFYACVGDDPTSNAPADDGGLNENETGPNVDGARDNDSGNGEPCAGGIMCDGVCVDSKADAKNCGRCAHDCGEGACDQGVCKSSLVIADPDAGGTITSITTDQGDDRPKGLAQRIFWSVNGAGGGVFQDNVIGGNTITLSTSGGAQMTNVVVEGTSAYWFSQNFGSSPQPLSKAQVNTAASQTSAGTINGPFIQSIMYDAASQSIVGSYAVSGTTHGTFKCVGAAACVNATTFTGQPGGNVAKDDSSVYFCDPDNGIILKSNFAGSSSTTYAQAQATPNLLRVDGTFLYWSNSGTKTIQRASLADASNTKQMASTTNAADGLAADAVNVYWTDSATGTLNYAPITGAGPSTAYVTLGTSIAPMRLVRDTGFLYFTHRGAIHRVALP
jgi:hypothetical protein